MELNARLLALIGLLRSTARPLSFSKIREELAPMDGYTGSVAAMRRKFERDKRALAELGVVFEYHAAHDGYSLSAESMRTRSVHFGPTETMVLREAAAAVTHDSGSPFAPELRGALVLRPVVPAKC